MDLNKLHRVQDSDESDNWNFDPVERWMKVYKNSDNQFEYKAEKGIGLNRAYYFTDPVTKITVKVYPDEDNIANVRVIEGESSFFPGYDDYKGLVDFLTQFFNNPVKITK